METINIFIALGAGLVTFFAPCTFAMLPIFISYLTNELTLHSNSEVEKQRKLIVGTLLYAGSFILVFTIMGLTATGIGQLFSNHRILFTHIMSLFIIFFGLLMLFGHKFKSLSFFFAEKKVHVQPSKLGKSYAFPITLGITSAFAWTPCVGPILGGILLLAGTTAGSIWNGALYLFVYGLGIMLPFLLIAFTLEKSRPFIHRFTRYTPIIYRLSAVLLILFGLLLLTDTWNYFFGLVFQIFDLFGYKPV